jgi:chromosomal replication initiator protein
MQCLNSFPHYVKSKSTHWLMNDKEFLTTILENIQTKVSPQVFNAYFTDLQIFSLEPESVTFAIKNAFIKQSVESRYFKTLHEITKKVLNKNDIELQFIVKAIKTEKNTSASALFNKAPVVQSIPLVTSVSFSPAPQTPIFESYLNKKYTFDTFIVGSHNQLAHAAAIAISDNPGNAYNPFFIYGGVGLGKTHLMQAIGNEVIKQNSNAKVLYCTTETFLNEMVNSIRTQKTAKFREKYRAMDILILDDIQFLSNKEALQEEFFNTFNTLYQAGKQIIIASDRPPGEIAHLEDRLRSRFEGGLVADMKIPNLETRMAIIQNKLIERNEFLPEPILEAVAECIDTNVRELEGALLRITINYKNTPNFTAADVKHILGAKILARRKKINPLDIMRTVCEQLEIDLKEVKSSKRNYDIAYARQICMYLLKDILNLQLIKIAKHVGRNDHTTVMHGINKIEQMMKNDLDTARLVAELKGRIQN